MAKATASALATARNFLTALVNANLSASTRPVQWPIVKSWYALFSENSIYEPKEE